VVPFVVLLVVTAAARVVGLGVPFVGSWHAATAVGLAAAVAVASSAHFVEPRRSGLISTVPPSVPRPDLVVTVTGVLEVAAAIGLLVEPLRTPAAIGLALLLVAVYPANVRAATGKRHPSAPTTPLVTRTVVQLGFLGACVVAAL
jgi:uncharacterized membrane protein